MSKNKTFKLEKLRKTILVKNINEILNINIVRTIIYKVKMIR